MADDDGPVLDTSAETGISGPDTGPGHVVVPVKIEEALAAAAMAAICLISFGNVIARYATNVSFAFTEEFSVFLLVFMAFVGASAAFAANEHIRITFFRQRMPPTLRWLSEIVTLLATDAGQVVVTGSHGALFGGDPRNALKADAWRALFNDAGGGAGTTHPPALQARSVAAATVAAASARIGDARSTWADGVISACNDAAAALGGKPGLTARELVDRALERRR